jgi:hypothetical protein
VRTKEIKPRNKTTKPTNALKQQSFNQAGNQISYLANQQNKTITQHTNQQTTEKETYNHGSLSNQSINFI